MKKIITKFAHPLRGIYVGLKHDRGVQFQALFLVVTVPFLYFFLAPFSSNELIALLIGYGLLFINEFQNSALEETLDHLHPETHENVRDSKDFSASSVLFSLLVFVGVVAIIIFGRI